MADIHYAGPTRRGRFHEAHDNGEGRGACGFGLASQTSGGLGRHCPAQLHGSVGKPAGGADERGRNPAESRAFRMGAPVRFQKAVSRSKETAAAKRRKASRPALRGRQVPSAEGTGPTARRPPGARNAPAPVGASPPSVLGGHSPTAAGRPLTRNDDACLESPPTRKRASADTRRARTRPPEPWRRRVGNGQRARSFVGMLRLPRGVAPL